MPVGLAGWYTTPGNPAAPATHSASVRMLTPSPDEMFSSSSFSSLARQAMIARAASSACRKSRSALPSPHTSRRPLLCAAAWALAIRDGMTCPVLILKRSFSPYRFVKMP